MITENGGHNNRHGPSGLRLGPSGLAKPRCGRIFLPSSPCAAEMGQTTFSCICKSRTENGMINARCRCSRGYSGNPYILDGCEVGILLYIVCPSLLALALVGLGVLYIFIRRQMRIKRRNKNFKRNGGLVLLQQINPTGSSVDTTKIFTSKELSKATGNFSEARVLGHGGQGRVYTGMLIDGRILAVKNGETLASWEVRVRIAKEIAESLCYLHTAASTPIFHRDIKTANIMLDDNNRAIAESLCYLHTTASTPIFHRDIKTANIMLDDNNRAKLADFGISRSVSEDQTHLTTIVIGTPGYLDPEYHQSNQYTEKSDVYSYGIVLAELITGEKPIFFNRSPENRTLVAYFNRAMNEKRLLEIIDAWILDESKVGQIVAAAHIAKNCLNLMRRERPVMRQVLAELESSCSSPEQPQPHVSCM
ncbi:LOW QUALITY PROTEIN: hypothetical protein Bca101_019426 [Brassica carinata]